MAQVRVAKRGETAATTTTGRCVGSSSRSRWCRRRRRRRGKANLETRARRRPADRQRGARKAASGDAAPPEPNAAKVRHRRRRASSLPPRRHRISVLSAPHGTAAARGQARLAAARRPPHSAAAAAPPAPQRHPAGTGVSRVWGLPSTTEPGCLCSSFRGKAGRCETCLCGRAERASLASTQNAARASQLVRGCAWRARGTESGRRRSPRASGRCMPPCRSRKQRASIAACLMRGGPAASCPVRAAPPTSKRRSHREANFGRRGGASLSVASPLRPSSSTVPPARHLAGPSRLSNSAVRGFRRLGPVDHWSCYETQLGMAMRLSGARSEGSAQQHRQRATAVPARAQN